MKILLNLKILIAACLISACMKAPQLNQDFGPEVSPDEIRATFSSVQTAQLADTKKCEQVSLDTVQSVESAAPVLIAQSATQILDRSEDANYYYFDLLLTESGRGSDGQMSKPTSKADRFAVKKINGGGTASVKSADKTTYHQLKKETVTYPTPAFVQRRADCGGLSEALCRNGLPSTKISFDKVDWKDGKGQKLSIEIVYSAVVPYLASELSNCLETFVSYPNPDTGEVAGRARVRQCSEVKDFRFGPAQSPTNCANFSSVDQEPL